MRVAVFYTGALRTYRRTFPPFRRNLLLHDGVHVFAALHASAADAGAEDEAWLRDAMGPHLKSLAWCTPQDPDYVAHREASLATMPLPESWKDYLRRSGSLFEHHQVSLAYEQMAARELAAGCAYDAIVRCRTDMVLGFPCDFHWLDLAPARIQRRLAHIAALTGQPSHARETLVRFMSSVWNEDRLLAATSVADSQVHPNDFTFDAMTRASDVDALCVLLRDYLRDGRYILTLRENLAYIVKREHATLIPCLGTRYGRFRTPGKDHWFDSESQFKAVCTLSGLSRFDSCTEPEARSLYEYDPAVYLDEAGAPRSSPDLMFFLMRR